METLPAGTDATPQKERAPQTGRGGGWLFAVLLLALLLVLAGFAKWRTNPPAVAPPHFKVGWSPTPLPQGKSVSLTIDFGNGASKEYAALPWQEQMTVAEALTVARDFRPGIHFTQVGEGESGFLSSLDGLANEGAEGRNWLYQVDDQHAHVSYCVRKIEPGAHVLWTFTDQQYNEITPSKE